MTILMSFQAVALGEQPLKPPQSDMRLASGSWNAKRTLRVLAPLPSRLARQEPLSPGISAQPIGQQAAVMALPWPVPPLARWPSLEPLVALALEMGSLLLAAGRSLAIPPPAASAVSMALPRAEPTQDLKRDGRSILC